MNDFKNYKGFFTFLIGMLFLCIIFNLGLGSVDIPLWEAIKITLGYPTTKPTFEYILLDYRIPKAITALLTGGSLGVCGLMMQTYFRNPLAGPYVLGISSGASLGVAILLMGSSVFGGWFTLGEVGFRWAIMIAASIGSIGVFSLILLASLKLKNSTSLLILGLMFGSLTAAIVNILMFFGSKEALQKYVFWSFGSLGNMNTSELKILSLFIMIGLIMSVFAIKNLNSLMLGETYAQSLGVSLKKSRYLIVISSSLLAGATTAFVGPIGFIGLAAPHLIRLLIPSTRDHKIILPAVFLGGALLLLICDSISQLPGSAAVLPINGITSLIGAPLIIFLILRQRN
ncbi:iron ABC transporter permease [Candidatus Arcticimaribacter forsetii]|uniref:iron ABC transporter permease n=1 Tax=Candidatus Arcticimaribacter forsetii TaxID=2820661 RepID=UPI0020770253|nr:iron ABC transporter permease [Candidatus Arcticimaribacter forsetii]MDA8639936.1 iron ABC transporter permease [Flavobacteriaceae bacterium]MDB2329998.1 iron ABC transporter permease [Flavobacteriaceae bacterium]MDB4643680.1 iron ABC transporter permease [Flavobacteriaceae bacterium]